MAADPATVVGRDTEALQAMVVARARMVVAMVVALVHTATMVQGRAIGPMGRASAAAARMLRRARSRLAGGQLSPVRRHLPAPRVAESREECVGERIVTFFYLVGRAKPAPFEQHYRSPPLSEGIAVKSSWVENATLVKL